MEWMKSVLRVAAFLLIAQASHPASFCARRFAISARHGNARCEPFHRDDAIQQRRVASNGVKRRPMVSSVAIMNETESTRTEKDAELTAVANEQQSQQADKRTVVFGTPPPAKEITRLLLKRSGKIKSGDKGMSSLTSQPVSAIGRLHAVRHLARSLCVCELVPPAREERGVPETYWEFGESKGMTVQLLMVGDLALSVDDFSYSTVLVRGSTIVDKKESLKNWAKNSQVDVKVSSIQRVNETIWTPLVFPRNTADKYPPLFQTCPLKSRREGLRYLRLSDLHPGLQSRQPVLFVDSLAAIKTFANSLSELKSTSAYGSNSMYVGIDCEWKPDTISEPDDVQPVLLLQISLHDTKEVYVLDLQTILRPLLPPGENLNSMEESVSSIISDLFYSSLFIKVGFQLVGDLRRLAASYPHMKCFGTVHGVLDVSRVARKVMRVVTRQRNSKFVTSSLARLVEHFLQRPIDKEQQCSDWSARPLSSAQLEYAALDAVIAPHLLCHSVLPEPSDIRVFRSPYLHVGRWIGDISFADCVTNWEFTPTPIAPAKHFRGESGRKRDKRHQRLFGNLPPVVTYRKACGPER